MELYQHTCARSCDAIHSRYAFMSYQDVIALYNECIMALFSRKLAGDECGVVVDVGSGSVGVAIVVSRNIEEELDVVWSYREHVIIRDKVQMQESLRDITTALVNAMLELGSTGLKKLNEYDRSLRVSVVQTAICAPWAYTVTKTINYEDEHPFEVDQAMIKSLIETAKKQTMETMVDGKIFEELGLRMITEDTLNIQVNGYTIKNPMGQEGRTLTLSHTSAVAREQLLTALDESLEKIFPRAQKEFYSFMYLFYRTLDSLHPDTSEICTIDVTNEATEIGIIRDNILKHTSHIPFGMYSLAREIALICNIPKEEAYSYIKNQRDISEGGFSKEKLDEVQLVFQKYEEKVAGLFKVTGDALSIPKTLFLHCSQETEEFFKERLLNASKKATSTSHTVHTFTSELLNGVAMEDTALAMSAFTFHMRERFE